MGIEPMADRDDVARQIAAKQDEIFDCIIARRRCLPIDLWRLPVADLMREVGEEMDGAAPSAEVLLNGLRRFLAVDHYGRISIN
jgi:hypothetical protein